MWDWLIGWLTDRGNEAVAAVAGLIPAVPPEVTAACSSIAAAVAWVAPVGWIVPFEALAVALGLIVIGMVAGLAIITVRILASYFTLGGGGT